MKTCREISALCSLQMEHPLPLRDNLSVRMHLMLCSGCRNFRDQMMTLRVAAQGFASGQAPGLDDAQSPPRTS